MQEGGVQKEKRREIGIKRRRCWAVRQPSPSAAATRASTRASYIHSFIHCIDTHTHTLSLSLSAHPILALCYSPPPPLLPASSSSSSSLVMVVFCFYIHTYIHTYWLLQVDLVWRLVLLSFVLLPNAAGWLACLLAYIMYSL